MSTQSIQLPAYTFDAARLEALAAFDILDTAPEEGFDSIVELATQLCACPVALVSLVDRDRQWFKARVNFPPCKTDLNSSVCAHALTSPDLLVVPDLTADPRTAANPLVTGEPFIRFYAGAPLRTKQGDVLGSLCVIDKTPRPAGLTPAQRQGLKALADQVMVQLELRRAVADQAKALHRHDVLVRTQSAISAARGDLDAVLDALVHGAMKMAPQAEGGVVEMREGEELVYRCARGSIQSHEGLRLPLRGSLAGSCLLSGEPILCPDVLADRRAKADVVEMLNLRSCLLVPVFQGGAAVGVLKLQSSRADTFTEDDVRAAATFASLVTAGLAEAAFRTQSEILQTVTDHVARAVFLTDAQGRVTFANPDAERMFGWSAEELIGRDLHDTLHHSHPDGRPYPADACALVQSLLTGQDVRDQENIFFRKDGGVVAVRVTSAPVLHGGRVKSAVLTVSDITERRAEQARKAASARLKVAMLELGDRLRDATKAAEVAPIMGEVLHPVLGLSHAGIGMVDHDAETVTVGSIWDAPGLRSIGGLHRFRDYGSFIDNLKRGETAVVDDAAADPRTAAAAEAFATISVASLVNIPLMEHGRFVSLFFVNKPAAHTWTEEEIVFLRNVGDRIRAAIAKLEAEAQQRVLNEELSHRLKNTLAMVQAIAIQTLKDVSEKEAVASFTERVHALSMAHDVLMQESWAAAPIAAVVSAVIGTFGQAERFATSGPDIRLGPRGTLSLSMLLHELATNAFKYGSLSVKAGHVEVVWRLDQAESGSEVVIDWREVGGPPAREPTRKGFGSRLLRMGLIGTGGVTLAYLETGFTAEMRASLAHAQAT